MPNRRISEQEVRARLATHHKGQIHLVKYAGKASARGSEFLCTDCGLTWRNQVTQVLKGAGCPTCSEKLRRAKISSSNAASEQDVQDGVSEIHGGEVTLLRYAGRVSRVKSEFRCLRCCLEWRTEASTVLRGHGCPNCANAAIARKTSARRRLAESLVRERIAKAHGDAVSMVEYAGTASGHSTFRCSDGHEWRATASQVYRLKTSCPVCAGQGRLTHQQVQERLDERHDQTIELVAYGGSVMASSSFCCKCCGHSWQTTADNVMNKSGCQRCSGYGFSNDQPAILYYLRIQTETHGLLYKIGITNRSVSERFPHTRDREAIEIVREWAFSLGSEARAKEREILQDFGAFRVELPASEAALYGGGNTELFSHDVLGLDHCRPDDL